MGIEFEVPVGAARDVTRRVRAAGGVEFTADTTPFDGSESLACAVWTGDDNASIFSPSAAWSDSDTGTYAITFSSANTSSLGAGIYWFRVMASSGGRTGEIDRGQFRLLASPGSSSSPLSYCSLDDVLEYAPWLEDLQADSDTTGFAEQRRRATTWLIDRLAGLWSSEVGRDGIGEWISTVGTGDSSEQWIRDQIEPLEPGSTPPDTTPERDSTPANFFDASVSTALLLRPDVVEIVARKTVALVCERQVGRAGDRSYVDLAATYEVQASNLFRAARFELDFGDPQTGSGTILRGGVTTRL